MQTRLLMATQLLCSAQGVDGRLTCHYWRFRERGRDKKRPLGLVPYPFCSILPETASDLRTAGCVIRLLTINSAV
jgi:hypothetical protein